MTYTDSVSANLLGAGSFMTGVITLNRPRALNALDHPMIRSVASALADYAADSRVQHVLIRSASPKAFCAGGDVRAVRDSDRSGDYGAGDSYFRDEYDLNYLIATYPKPVVALVDGLAMGGGLGVSMHASHRVITEKAWASMPEAAIGFVTDVGISRVFTHLPTRSVAGRPSYALGLWLAATGYRLTAGDLLWTGLATAIVKDAHEFTERLVAQGVEAALDNAEPASSYPDSPLEHQVDQIEELCAGTDLGIIVARLSDAADAGDNTAKLTLELLEPASPLSLEAMVQLLSYSSSASLREALDAEFSVGALLRHRSDFGEGVRAVLVDKSKDAAFSPATIEQITAADRNAIAAALAEAHEASARRHPGH